MANLQIGPECVYGNTPGKILSVQAESGSKKYKNTQIRQRVCVCVCVYRKSPGKSVQGEDFGRQSRIAQVAEQM